MISTMLPGNEDERETMLHTIRQQQQRISELLAATQDEPAAAQAKPPQPQVRKVEPAQARPSEQAGQAKMSDDDDDDGEDSVEARVVRVGHFLPLL